MMHASLDGGFSFTCAASERLPGPDGTPGAGPCPLATGDQVLSLYGMDAAKWGLSTAGGYIFCAGILAAFVCASVVGAYLLLLERVRAMD